jgi:hypothetical protein
MQLPKSREQAKKLGLTYYFTGQPCIYGHVDTRRVSNGLCSGCAKERTGDIPFSVEGVLEAVEGCKTREERILAMIGYYKDCVPHTKDKYVKKYLLEVVVEDLFKKLDNPPPKRMYDKCRQE